MSVREAPTGYPLWQTEDGDQVWTLGPHTEVGRWEARRAAIGELGWDDYPVPRAYRVWIAKHVCEEPEWCWCSAFDGGESIDEVPKGTPGAVPGWRIEGR